MASEFHFSTTPPEFVSDLPRDSKMGTVVEEVGVVENTESGETFWKVFQVIEKPDGSELIRPGYYTENGRWQNKPLLIPPENMADLVEFAEGKIW